MKETLPGYQFPDAPTRERVAVLELQVKDMRSDVSELKASVQTVDDKVDKVLLLLADKKPSTPPDGVKLQVSGKALAGFGAGLAALGAGLIKLVEFLAAKP